MYGTHGSIIADAAKQALTPLGFRRKGRSRIWLSDHGWWLNVVEFQPSNWSDGSYLNVAAHWLWSSSGHLSLDFGGRMPGFEEYISDEQFDTVARKLAGAAAEEAHKLDRAFASVDATADALLQNEASQRTRGEGSWSAYHAAVAAALAGRESEAEALFRSITDGRVRADAESLLRLLPTPSRFKGEVSSLVARQRNALHLAELAGPPF
jgi:Domain of unknown function (DUF4304)